MVATAMATAAMIGTPLGGDSGIGRWEAGGTTGGGSDPGLAAQTFWGQRRRVQRDLLLSLIQIGRQQTSLVR